MEPAKYLPKLAAIRYSGVTADFAFAPNGNLLKAPVTLSTVKTTLGPWKRWSAERGKARRYFIGRTPLPLAGSF